MLLYTSYYARSGTEPNAVSISAKAPPFYKGKKFLALAPTWDLLNAYKSGKIDDRGYTEWYMRLLIKERKLDPHDVVEQLGDGAIMLCYEAEGKFCHRHLAAEWIESKTGVIVREITKNDPPKLVDELVDFG